MSDENAGNLLSGKEDERLPNELTARARRAKLSRKGTVKPETQEAALVEQTAAVKVEDKQGEDFYFDALLRFGIQI